MATYGGIEAGGTKFVCAVGSGPQDLRDIIRIPTTTPSETIGHVIDFFSRYKGLSAIGIAAFGPVDLMAISPVPRSSDGLLPTWPALSGARSKFTPDSIPMSMVPAWVNTAGELLRVWTILFI